MIGECLYVIGSEVRRESLLGGLVSFAQKKYMMLKVGAVWTKVRKTKERAGADRRRKYKNEKTRREVDEVGAIIHDRIGKIHTLRLDVPYVPLPLY